MIAPPPIRSPERSSAPFFKTAGRTKLVSCLFLLMALLAASTPAWAQSSQATLEGRVTNPGGEAIAKALVLERNVRTNAQAYRYTNEQGYYSFAALPPGAYSVRADALGFQPEERDPVELPVASQIELNFALEPAAAPPARAPAANAPSAAPPANANPSNILAIMYGADAAVPQAVMIQLPQSQTETLAGSVSYVIDENKILELPLNGRDVYTLLVLQPGVSSDNATERGLGFSVNGNRVSSSDFLLDGVDNNNLTVTGPATLVSADAVQEYRMVTNNFSAEFGRSSAFVANVITRSGTNQLHGTVYEFLQNALLDANSFANNWQDLPKEPFELNQYGGSLGGPVRRNRLFYFVNFEQARSSTESEPATLFFPGPALVASAAPGSIAQQLLTEFPPPAGQPASGGLVSENFRYPLPQVNTFALGRADYTSANGRQRLSLRYSFSQETEDDFITSPYPDLNSPLVVRGQNLSFNYTTDVQGGTNELKFGYNRNLVQVLRPDSQIPTLNSEDGVVLPGSEAAYSYSSLDSVFDLVDNYSRLKGSHALVMGAEYAPDLSSSLLSAGEDGEYIFPNVSSFLSDSPSLSQITLNRQTGLPAQNSDFWRYYLQNYAAAFFLDNWKVAPRLTLNLGLRWEYYGPPDDRNGAVDYNYVFGPGANIEDRIAAGSIQPGPLYRPDYTNFAPRFGFAWDALGSGRTVMRGGFGIFYDRIFDNFWMDTRANNLALQQFVPSAGQPFGYTIPASSALTSPATVTPSVDVAVDPGLRTPYAENWFLGIQQELTPNTELELNQTGSLGRELATADIINREFSVTPTAENPEGRFNPNAPDISYRSNQGYSNSAALQVELNRRWNEGFQFQASYTLSHTLDVQSDPEGRTIMASSPDRAAELAAVSLFSEGPGFLQQFDPQSDYGNADFDQRQDLVFNMIGQVPYALGLPRPLSGWQFATIAGFRSGFPFTVVTSAPSNAAALNPLSNLFIFPGRGLAVSPVGGGSMPSANRADFVCANYSQAFLGTPTPIPGGAVLLNPACFSNPANNVLGDTSRNAFYGPGFWNVDLSLSRTFALPRLGEGVSLQFRVELFNAFNHTNLNNPDVILGSSEFGQATYGREGVGSSSPAAAPLNDQPRHVQLALKLYF